MLDKNLIKENPQLVKENLKKRFQHDKIKLVNDFIKSHREFLNLKKQIESLRHKRNILSLEINKLVKQGNKLVKQGKKPIKKISEAKQLPKKIEYLEKEQNQISERIHNILSLLPNIIHESVPLGKDKTQNKIIKKQGAIPKFNFSIKNHVELVENLNLADFDASAKTSGNGFYFLKGDLALLNQALIRFAIDFMYSKGYYYIEPPLMLKTNILQAATDLETLKDSIYKVEGEDISLIGTSEYSLLAFHIGQTIKEEDLPKKYFSYSMCFRKEIGSHGINEKGLWRTHQFNKVEQFIFCKPKDSYKYYDELLKNSEEIYKKLKIPYRVLEMCSGELASWKAKSTDIEAYRPTTKTYEEVGSLTNCTDYQARKLNIRFINKKGTKEVLHTLNSTAIATSRAMVVIIENYQQKDGSIKIPDILRKYMDGIKKIEKKIKKD